MWRSLIWWLRIKEVLFMRFIVHNIMVCQDFVRRYSGERAKPSVSYEIRYEKSWDFHREMLEHLKFSSHFVKLSMVYVRTSKFSLMINDSLHRFFEAKRGLRQGFLSLPFYLFCVWNICLRLWWECLIIFINSLFTLDVKISSLTTWCLLMMWYRVVKVIFLPCIWCFKLFNYSLILLD